MENNSLHCEAPGDRWSLCEREDAVIFGRSLSVAVAVLLLFSFEFHFIYFFCDLKLPFAISQWAYSNGCCTSTSLVRILLGLWILTGKICCLSFAYMSCHLLYLLRFAHEALARRKHTELERRNESPSKNQRHKNVLAIRLVNVWVCWRGLWHSFGGSLFIISAIWWAFRQPCTLPPPPTSKAIINIISCHEEYKWKFPLLCKRT